MLCVCSVDDTSYLTLRIEHVICSRFTPVQVARNGFLSSGQGPRVLCFRIHQTKVAKFSPMYEPAL